MNMQEVWNLVGIGVLLAAVSYQVLYYVRHTNGKKYLRIWTGVVLLVVLCFRLLLATGAIDNDLFQQLNRPWSVLVYLLPCLDAYIDWRTHRKS